MFFNHQIATALCGALSASALVITVPQKAYALTGEEINDIARETTVLIQAGNPGSGVIIANNGDTYYVLTARHVVESNDDYAIVTHDKKEHETRNVRILHRFQGVDLAIVEFVNQYNGVSYSTATLAKTEHVREGQTVFISGWPYPGESINERIRQFTTGEISGLPERPLSEGYQLVYTNITRVGMSGAPVFDTSARLIGIHGRAESVVDGEHVEALQSGGEDFVSNAQTVGFNLGVPTNTFLSNAQQNNLYLNLRVENSPPQNPGVSFDTSRGVDPRDRIENIHDTLTLIEEGANVFDRVRDVFRF